MLSKVWGQLYRLFGSHINFLVFARSVSLCAYYYYMATRAAQVWVLEPQASCADGTFCPKAEAKCIDSSAQICIWVCLLRVQASAHSPIWVPRIDSVSPSVSSYLCRCQILLKVWGQFYRLFGSDFNFLVCCSDRKPLCILLLYGT